MRRTSREALSVGGGASVAKGGLLDALKDVSSVDLQKLAKKLGNEDVQALMGESRDKRDQLLQFIQERLAAMGMAQQAELESLKAQRVWWDEVAKGKAGYHLPDPTRWHAAAGLYRKATELLQQGNLGRAAELLKQAIDADRAAFQDLPRQVRLPADRRAAPKGPDVASFISSGEGCPVTRAPALLEAADRISSVTERSENVPGVEFHKLHRWWEAVEEEPEEAKKDEDPKKKGRRKDG